MALPTIVCLKSVYNNKYLQYRLEEVQTHGLLRFSGVHIKHAHTQFEVVKAKIGDGLIHLKSRYSNKFLVRWSPSHNWISASADEVNEDQSSWGCTLFKPIFINKGDTTKIRLQHVQLGHYACLWRIDAPFDSCLFAATKDPDNDSCDIFEVVDWVSALKLPKNVAFKGENGKYLGAFENNGHSYLQFAYDDPNDPKVAQEVFSYPDGTVCIKSKYYGKYWRLGNDDWIWADVKEDPRLTNNGSAMFRPHSLDMNVFVLLNMAKTWYCKRYTAGGSLTSLLKAATQNVDEWAKLEVKDLGI